MRKVFKGALALGVGAMALAVPASARHSWGGYHWARTSNPFALVLADNVSSAWDPSLATAVVDWSKSSVLDTVAVAGRNNPRRCAPTAGRVEVCNYTYGRTGWLGIASISITSGNHITAGTVKLNDTYYSTPTYNTPAWRNLVMCQEIGHTFGLGHQDENHTNPNLNTCMDYTNSPSSNQHPNQHDYDQLMTIYSHLDGGTTLRSATQLSARDLVGADVGITPKSWGQPIQFRRDGKPSVYLRRDGPDRMTLTHVFWVPGLGPEDNHVHE